MKIHICNRFIDKCVNQLVNRCRSSIDQSFVGCRFELNHVIVSPISICVVVITYHLSPKTPTLTLVYYALPIIYTFFKLKKRDTDRKLSI